MINYLLVLSQPPCTTNPVANDFCQSATPICNLNGYCGNTSSVYTNWVSTSNHNNETYTPLGNVFCATIQNNSWLKFIADSTVAVFNVWVSNCNNNKGIQMQIYSTTNCYNFTPVSNCWNPGFPTNGQITATNLIPGNVYYFMIDGTQGDVCDYVISANIGVGSTPTITANQSICKGDTAFLTASGGSAFLWSSVPVDASLASQQTLNSIKVKPLVNTVYRVIVTKSGSNAFCPNNVDTLYSLVTVKPIPMLSITSTKDHCNLGDGSATVIATGGSGVFSYVWNTSPLQTTAIASGLLQGNYKVVVTDTNACKVVDSVIVLSDTVLLPVISGSPFLCHATTAVLNAGSNYSSYLWSTAATSQTITISSAGTYSVKVTKNACVGYDTLIVADITVPPPLIIAPAYICFGDTVQLNAGSGYSGYLWSTNLTSQLISITSGGTYSVIVNDSNACKANASVFVAQKYGPTLSTSSVNEICNRGDGSASVVATGGQGSYTYLWSNGSNLPSINGLQHGIYNVTVNDSLCESKTSVVVVETPGPVANFSVKPSIQIYFGEPVTFVFTDISQGNITNWQWNFDDGSFGNIPDISHNYTMVGNYIVTLIVTDNNACVDSTGKIIIVRDLFTFYIPNAFTPNGDGINDVFTPEGSNVDAANFEMYIYSRWGNLVYWTKNWNGDSADPWDGTINNTGEDNKKCEGIFVYKILVKELAGAVHQYSGIVTVIP